MRREVLVTEFLKLRRTGVPWATLVAILCAPMAIALLMWIVQDPERAASLGLVGTKANLAGLEATWTAYGGYLAVLVGAGGMMLIAFIVAFLFGREYADGTARNMLALPVDRGWFAFAKLTVAAVWWLGLALAGLAEGLLIGWAMGLPGFSGEAVAGTAADTLTAAGAAFLLAPVLAWITVWSRSYLAALGFALASLLVGDLLGHTGWGVWFPWSIVPLLTGMATTASALPWFSYVVLAVTFAVGVVGTVLQLRYADHP